MDVIGRCYDCSHNSLVLLLVAEAVIIKIAGKLLAIAHVRIEDALRHEDKMQSLISFRSRLLPSLIIRTSSGQIALCNVSLLVVDNDLRCEDMLMLFPVLLHLCIDSNTWLDKYRTTLDETVCVEVGNPTIEHMSRVGTLTVS